MMTESNNNKLTITSATTTTTTNVQRPQLAQLSDNVIVFVVYQDQQEFFPPCVDCPNYIFLYGRLTTSLSGPVTWSFQP